MSFDSIEAARAELAARRKANTTPRVQWGWDSDFWPESDLMDIDPSEADTVFWETLWFSEAIARDVSDIIDSPTKTLLFLDNIELPNKMKLRPHLSIISIKISGELRDNKFLDLIFIKFSSALPNNELLQLRDIDGTLYVWNGRNETDGSIMLIKWEKWADGKMNYRKKYETNNGRVRLTFNSTKY